MLKKTFSFYGNLSHFKHTVAKKTAYHRSFIHIDVLYFWLRSESIDKTFKGVLRGNDRYLS